MWTITQNKREQFERTQVLVIRESDQEWVQAIEEGDTEYEAFRAQYFEEVKPQLFTILPEYFHPYIKDGSINRRDIPPVVRTPFCTEAGVLTESDAVYIGDVRVANTLAECISFIHSELYEDPHAIFSEPVAKADLLDYALGADLEKKVRAWNTMYANPQELASIINQILLQMDRKKEDEMLQYAYIIHFSKEDILTLAVWQKFSDLFE